MFENAKAEALAYLEARRQRSKTTTKQDDNEAKTTTKQDNN
jgi:hypothetical protein